MVEPLNSATSMSADDPTVAVVSAASVSVPLVAPAATSTSGAVTPVANPVTLTVSAPVTVAPRTIVNVVDALPCMGTQRFASASVRVALPGGSASTPASGF